MIQSTSRLSRGARLRRGWPSWIYAVMVLAGVAFCGLVLLILKP